MGIMSTFTEHPLSRVVASVWCQVVLVVVVCCLIFLLSVCFGFLVVWFLCITGLAVLELNL